jgi:hypothetical protein
MYALESGQRALMERMDHLDECVDGIKVNVAKWRDGIRAMIWLLIGVVLASSSGFISLQHLLEVLKIVKAVP